MVAKLIGIKETELANDEKLVWGASYAGENLMKEPIQGAKGFLAICKGEVATPSEKEWAKTVWPFPVTEQIEGAKGLIEMCPGELPKA